MLTEHRTLIPRQTWVLLDSKADLTPTRQTYHPEHPKRTHQLPKRTHRNQACTTALFIPTRPNSAGLLQFSPSPFPFPSLSCMPAQTYAHLAAQRAKLVRAIFLHFSGPDCIFFKPPKLDVCTFHGLGPGRRPSADPLLRCRTGPARIHHPACHAYHCCHTTVASVPRIYALDAGEFMVDRNFMLD